MGMGADIRSWITVAGLDVVRDSDGSFKVLEDNLRTPSGIAYAVATREVLRRAPAASAAAFACARSTPPSRRSATRCAPPRPSAAGEDPVVVLLSDGKANSAFYEHATIARHLGLPLVLAEQLSVRRGRLFARLRRRRAGRRRRLPAHRRGPAADDHGRPTGIAQLLLEPMLAGHARLRQRLRHRRRRRQAAARLRRGHGALLPRRGAAAAVGPHLRPRPARRAGDDPRAHRRARDQAPHAATAATAW